MASWPIPVSDLATPAEYAKFHGLSLANTYRLIQARLLRVVNTSAGIRPTYRLPLDQLPGALSPEDASEDIAISSRVARGDTRGGTRSSRRRAESGVVCAAFDGVDGDRIRDPLHFRRWKWCQPETRVERFSHFVCDQDVYVEIPGEILHP